MKISKNVKYFLASDTLGYSADTLVTLFLTLLISTQLTDNRTDIVGYILSYYLIFTGIVGVLFAKFNKNKTFEYEKRIISLVYFIQGILTIVLGLSTSIVHIIAALSLKAVLDGVSYPIKWTIFSKIQDHNSQEFEWGLENLFTASIAALLSALMGYFSQRLGLNFVFTFLGTLYILSGLAFYKIHETPLLKNLFKLG